MKNCKPVCCHFSVLGTQGRLNPVRRSGKWSAEMICPFLVWHILLYQAKFLIRVVEESVSGSLLSVCVLCKVL